MKILKYAIILLLLSITDGQSYTEIELDGGYRGELMVPVDNPTDDDYMITPGERLFQIILPNLEEFEVEIVDYLSDSERGDGGFGSTGK